MMRPSKKSVSDAATKALPWRSVTTGPELPAQSKSFRDSGHGAGAAINWTEAFVYIGVAASQLILRRKTPPEQLHVKAWLHPWGSIFAIAGMTAVLVASLDDSGRVLAEDTRTTEFRQERFLAAIDWTSTEPFRLAYIVRAISPGTYHLPAASVEDMYRPDYRARTDAGSVTVTE